MSFKAVLISFFKENNIDYYFEKKNANFPCPSCFETIKIDINSTEWECSDCQIEGNLKTLVNILKEGLNMDKVKIYNPRKERKEIEQILKSLIKEEKVEGNQVKVLSDKISDFMSYCLDGKINNNDQKQG